jgi:hypothetical protein
MRKHIGWNALVVCLALASASPALAQQQTVNFTIGGFVPRSEEARVTGDVLSENRTFLVFDLDEFNSLSTGVEWLFPIGRFVEGGAGVSFTGATVPTVYDCCVDNNGREIEQELRLRRVPIDLTLRVTPLGPSSPVQLYAGGGITLISWRYTESGDFIDFNDNGVVFSDEFEASGTEPGAVFLGGVRFQGRKLTGGFELRYHKADADFDADDDEFAAPRIDLGGWTYQATVGFRF